MIFWGIMNRNQLSGLFGLAISIFVCIEAIRSDIGTFQTPGPGFLPFWIGVVLGVLAMMLVVVSILREKVDGRIMDIWKGIKWRNVVLVLASLFLYAIILPRIGYLIATFGLMTLLYGMMGRPRLWVQIMSAFVTVLVSYIIFHFWLKVSLPKGVFGL